MEIIDNQSTTPVVGQESQSTHSEQQPSHKPVRRQRSMYGFVFAVVGVFIAANILGSIIKMVLDKTLSASGEFSTFISYLFCFGVTIGFALYERKRLGIRSGSLHVSFKGFNPTIVLWGVILVFITSSVIEPLLELFPAKYLDQLASAIGRGGWAMLTAIIAAPILEEILFRGIIQGTLVRGYGAVRGVIVASAIFGIIHIIPQQAINAFFVGLVLGYIYLKTKSLLNVIVIHAINNAISFVMMSIFTTEQSSTRTMIGNDTIYWIFYAVCVVAFIVAWITIFRFIRNMPQETDNNQSLQDVVRDE